jgi:hypothetical protein
MTLFEQLGVALDPNASKRDGTFSHKFAFPGILPVVVEFEKTDGVIGEHITVKSETDISALVGMVLPDQIEKFDDFFRSRIVEIYGGAE